MRHFSSRFFNEMWRVDLVYSVISTNVIFQSVSAPQK